MQLVKGNIFQFASLNGLFENCNTLFIAVGSRPSLDPLGPFNVDYQAWLLPEQSPSLLDY